MSSLSSSAIVDGTGGTRSCLQARELSCHYAAIVALQEVPSNHAMHCVEHSRNADVTYESLTEYDLAQVELRILNVSESHRAGMHVYSPLLGAGT